MVSNLQIPCVDLWTEGLADVTRILAFLAAALVSGAAIAADKPPVANARAVKASYAKSELNAAGEPNLPSSAVMVFDPQTGQTLYSKNADQQHPIASITKLMTVLVTLDHKKLGDVVTVDLDNE
jgi:D-alanyl-D-alanine carboxypeptidase